MQPFDESVANAITADGWLIFGGGGSPFLSIPRAFVWTAAAGMRSLQDIAVENGVTIPEGYLLTNVVAASTDGKILLGVAYDPQGRQVSYVLQLPVSAYGL